MIQMTTNKRFHGKENYKKEYPKKLLVKRLENGTITLQDKKLIEEFTSELSSDSHISTSRKYKLTIHLTTLREFLPPYADCDLQDVRDAIEGVKDATKTKKDGTVVARYKPNTITDLVMLLKRFFIWLVENDYSDIKLTKLNKIKIPKADKLTVTPEQLLTEEEVKSIIEACDNIRDKALISVLYEGALRISEVASLRFQDVKFTDWNVTITTAEKTGQPRYIPLVSSRAYLAQYMNEYPSKPIAPDKFVFLTLTKQKVSKDSDVREFLPLQYQGLVKHIRSIAKRAGITKHIKPHIFRHSRITHMLQSGMHESHIKLIAWGSVNTEMLRTYLHLTNSDLENEVAKLNGISIDSKTQEKKQSMKPVQCRNCATINPSTARYCVSCGKPLHKEEIQTIDGLKEELDRMFEEKPHLVLEMYSAMTSKIEMTE